MSKDVTDFLRRCLDPEPTARILASAALDHSWIRRLGRGGGGGGNICVCVCVCVYLYLYIYYVCM